MPTKAKRTGPYALRPSNPGPFPRHVSGLFRKCDRPLGIVSKRRLSTFRIEQPSPRGPLSGSQARLSGRDGLMTNWSEWAAATNSCCSRLLRFAGANSQLHSSSLIPRKTPKPSVIPPVVIIFSSFVSQHCERGLRSTNKCFHLLARYSPRINRTPSLF